MTKRTLFLSLGMAIITATGCAFTKETIPEAEIPFARASYELGGETSAESCGTYFFGINWEDIFGNETASTVGGDSVGILDFLFGGGPTEQAEATYIALQSMPGATHLLAPRAVNTFSGFGTLGIPLFGERCSRVKARAVKMGGPNPVQ